jgi:hypothetical protein
MPGEYENHGARPEEVRQAVETWEDEGGAQPREHSGPGVDITSSREPDGHSPGDSRSNPGEMRDHAQGRGQHEAMNSDQRRRDRGRFVRLSRRYAQLGHAFDAAAQRERAGLHAPLVEVYSRLHPRSRYTQLDDLDVIMRAHHRSSSASVPKESNTPGAMERGSRKS